MGPIITTWPFPQTGCFARYKMINTLIARRKPWINVKYLEAKQRLSIFHYPYCPPSWVGQKRNWTPVQIIFIALSRWVGEENWSSLQLHLVYQSCNGCENSILKYASCSEQKRGSLTSGAGCRGGVASPFLHVFTLIPLFIPNHRSPIGME